MYKPISKAYRFQVFINCPFDEAYWPMLQAMVFAVHACGFVPRCAMEADDAGEERLGKILRIIAGCQLGINDLSRKGPDSTSGMSRFNMPFEMGLFLGAARFGSRKKAMLVMEKARFDYQRCISDISGRDIKHHGNDPLRLIIIVRDWLNAQGIAPHLPGGRHLARMYERFRAGLPAALQDMRLDPSEVGLGHFINWTHLVAKWVTSQPE